MATLTNIQPVSGVQAKESKKSYKDLVLGGNQVLKSEVRTLGFALKLIRDTAGISPQFQKIARELLKDSEMYKNFANNVRKTKAGNFTPFYVMQAIYRGLK
jgi:hypothetical protein